MKRGIKDRGGVKFGGIKIESGYPNVHGRLPRRQRGEGTGKVTKKKSMSSVSLIFISLG